MWKYDYYFFFSFSFRHTHFFFFSLMDANNKSTQLPPATKWIQNSEDSDSDQIGLVPHNRGYKHILFFYI